MNIRRILHSGGLLLMFALLMTSCHGMWDDVGDDCTTHKHLRFTYDWNMLYADAFPHEVKTLTVYAFASDGTLVWSRTASTDSIIAKGYMDVDDMPSGNYRLQVWAQGEERYANSYLFGSPLSGTNARSGLTAAITEAANRTAPGSTSNEAPGSVSNEAPGSVSNETPGSVSNDIVVAHDINALYYGTLSSADFTDMPRGGTREATVNLMKDTENFHIVLQDQSGQTVDPSAFRFTITDDNGSLDADNNLVNTGDTLRYNAWSVKNGEAGIASSDSVITGLSAVVAELTTNRMVKGHNMRLHVARTSDGKEIINIPLIDLCLLVKGNYNSNMSDQEYLDRQDTWNLIFFLSRENDRQYGWLSASIYVQQWRVVLQNADI